MAKDPAFLFYTGDFSTGTQFFTDEQVGKYIRLLMAQHQHGHLTEQQVLFICKSYDNEVMKKFIKDDSGLWYNERLEVEIFKRKAYSKSRSDNRKNKAESDKQPEKHILNISKTYVKHMENENEIKDKKEDKNEIPTKEDFLNYCKTLPINIEGLKFSLIAKYNAWHENGWKDGNGRKIKNWKSKIQNTIPFLKEIKIELPKQIPQHKPLDPIEYEKSL